MWLSLSCFLMAKLFRIDNFAFPVLLAGILAVNITTIAMTATYLYEMDADLFAVFLGVLAVFLWDRYGWPGTFLGVLFVTCCMGTYQSMVSVPVTLIMLLSIAALLHGEGFSPVLMKGLRAILMLAVGLAIFQMNDILLESEALWLEK